MKLNKLSLSLAITLALGSTFGMAHAETTAAHVKSEISATANKAEVAAKADEHRVDTSVKNDAKRIYVRFVNEKFLAFMGRPLKNYKNVSTTS